jgi:hypothetical protein
MEVDHCVYVCRIQTIVGVDLMMYLTVSVGIRSGLAGAAVYPD